MSKANLPQLLSAPAIDKINSWIEKYPAKRKRAAVIPALSIAQDELGYLARDTMDAVADYLEIPHIAAYEVATFYSMFSLEPRGKHVVSLCTNISCMLAGSDDLKQWFKDELGIAPGETTADGRITLKEVECLAACGGAPMLEVGKQYHENLDVNKLAHLVKELT
ncbi:NAD(P)H-dependent oxidoreductase subunit E [Kangiella sp. TOML190]|uniref:NADH-quinone oxidoreductase subunit NuoE family protein n=1 Tax=Kangiella sp. TOML190 TaxID=2931351 RepID=UPI00203A8C98|nr:NAD(P)H-dependent oxidoreductase subunit E [Kangiella sp. TOML190]